MFRIVVSLHRGVQCPAWSGSTSQCSTILPITESAPDTLAFPWTYQACSTFWAFFFLLVPLPECSPRYSQSWQHLFIQAFAQSHITEHFYSSTLPLGPLGSTVIYTFVHNKWRETSRIYFRLSEDFQQEPLIMYEVHVYIFCMCILCFLSNWFTT